MNSTATIFTRLSTISTGSLASYGGSRAIFDDRAPDDFLDAKPDKPFLIISAPARDEPLETFTETGRLIVQDVRGYVYGHGSTAALDTLMRSVRDLFHNRPGDLTVSGGVCEICRVTGPVQSPVSDPAFVGRRVTIRMELRNT